MPDLDPADVKSFRSYSCSAPWTSHCTDYCVTPHYCYVSLQS